MTFLSLGLLMVIILAIILVFCRWVSSSWHHPAIQAGSPAMLPYHPAWQDDGPPIILTFMNMPVHEQVHWHFECIRELFLKAYLRLAHPVEFQRASE